MKYLNLIFAAIFLLFALVQLNDPDPLIWMSLYGYTMIMFILQYLGKANKWALIAGAVIYLPLAIYYFPGNISDWINAEEQSKSLKMSMPFVEEARESLGLLISFIAVSSLLVINFRKSGKSLSVNLKEVRG